MKYVITLSASFCIGGLEFCASCTIDIICESTVLSPVFVTLNLNVPSLFIDPPITTSPTFFSIGVLSPVTNDSST